MACHGNCIVVVVCSSTSSAKWPQNWPHSGRHLWTDTAAGSWPRHALEGSSFLNTFQILLMVTPKVTAKYSRNCNASCFSRRTRRRPGRRSSSGGGKHFMKKVYSLTKLNRAGETEGEDYLQFETSVLRCRSEAQDHSWGQGSDPEPYAHRCESRHMLIKGICTLTRG